ncbi:SDR family oxidoreductase [Nocardia rhamnosiphila]
MRLCRLQGRLRVPSPVAGLPTTVRRALAQPPRLHAERAACPTLNTNATSVSRDEIHQTTPTRCSPCHDHRMHNNMHNLSGGRLSVAVTCASSRMGQSVVRQLVANGHRPTAIARTRGVFDRDEFRGTTVIPGDFANVDELVSAFEGADAICSALPSLAGDRSLDYARNLVDAARRAGVRRVVHNSMMWAPNEPCGEPFYDAVLELEEVIANSGLDVTIFRPVLFMDNLLTGFAKPHLVEHGVYRYCQKPGLASNWIAMDDVAKFVVAALSRDDLNNRRITIGGPEALVVDQVVQVLSEALHRPATYQYEEPYSWSARVHDEMGLEAVMPRDAYSEAMGKFYTFNNESPHKPFQVDMQQVLAEIPIHMVGLREWALSQNWDLDGNNSVNVGSPTG